MTSPPFALHLERLDDTPLVAHTLVRLRVRCTGPLPAGAPATLPLLLLCLTARVEPTRAALPVAEGASVELTLVAVWPGIHRLVVVVDEEAMRFFPNGTGRAALDLTMAPGIPTPNLLFEVTSPDAKGELHTSTHFVPSRAAALVEHLHAAEGHVATAHPDDRVTVTTATDRARLRAATVRLAGETLTPPRVQLVPGAAR